MKSSPGSLQLEKARMQQWRPNAAKKKKKKSITFTARLAILKTNLDQLSQLLKTI